VNENILAQAVISKPRRQRAAGRAKSGQGGATFVEAAFIILPLMVILLGIIDFGLAVFVKATLQHAVREGVRYAITYQTISGMGHDASIQEIVRRNCMGFLSAQQAAEKVRIRYYNPSLYNPANPGEWGGALVTGVGSNAPGNIVEVAIEEYRWGFIMPTFFRSPLSLGARASDKMEGLPGGGSPPPR